MHILVSSSISVYTGCSFDGDAAGHKAAAEAAYKANTFLAWLVIHCLSCLLVVVRSRCWPLLLQAITSSKLGHLCISLLQSFAGDTSAH